MRIHGIYRVSFAKIKANLGCDITRTVKVGVEEVVQLVQGNAIQDFGSSGYRN